MTSDAKGKEIKIGDTVLVIRNTFDERGSIVANRGKRFKVVEFESQASGCTGFRISDLGIPVPHIPAEDVDMF